MESTPVERNPVTRFIVGFAVIAAMTVGGGAVGALFDSVGVPGGEYTGVAVGAGAVFVAFAAWYRRYDAAR